MDQKDAQIEQGAHAEGSENQNNMASLLEKEGLGLDFPQAGEIRTGENASISPNQILVSVCKKSDGIITGRELEAIPADELAALESTGNSMSSILRTAMATRSSFTRARKSHGKNRRDVGAHRHPQQDCRIQQRRVDCPGGRFARLCARVANQPLPLGRFQRETPAKWSSMVGEEIMVVIEVDRTTAPIPNAPLPPKPAKRSGTGDRGV